MRKILLLLIVFALVLLTLFSCTPAAPEAAASDTGFTYSFVDIVGTQITLTARPQKVAVLFSSYADLWQTAGGEIAVTVGEAIERKYANENCILVDSGAGHTTIDMETLVSERPDLVIGTADYDCQVKACATLNELGIPAALFRIETFEDYLAALKICTDLTGNTDAYKVSGTDVQTRMVALLAAVPTERETKILFVRAGSSARSTKAKGTADHFAAAMLASLGMKNIADTDAALLDGLSLENIVSEDPTWIFVTTMGDESSARAYFDNLLAEDGWKNLSAVQAGRVVYLPKELFQFKPNARWADAYAYLLGILYPELNAEP